MNTELGTDDGPKTPALKIPAVGGTVTMQLVDYSSNKVQQTDYETGEPITWPDGKPKYSTIITGYVTATNGGAVGSADNPEELVPTQVVNIWADGGKWRSWKDCREAARASMGRGFKTGDVLEIVRGPDVPNQNPRLAARHDWQMTLREPTAGTQEVETAKLCEQLYQERAAEQTALDHVPGQDEDPF